MGTPSSVGATAEAAVAAALVAAGRRVFLPVFGSDGRVDLVYEDERGLHRVQCKTARRGGDAIYFRTCSNTRNVPRSYEGEVDEFGVYSPHSGDVFVVPASGLPQRMAHLRLAPTRNGQAKGVRWASDYRLDSC